jgi:hypothetical protein
LRGDRIIGKPITAAHQLLVAALCSVATLLIPAAAQAKCLRTDLNRDGVRDRGALSRGASELAVQLSTTHHWERRQTGDLIVRFVVTDVDRDGDPDLVASTPGSGLRVWINKGRGLFSSRSRQVKAHRLHLVTRRFGHSVRGVQSVRWDDSVLNDPTRLLIVWAAPPSAHLVAVCPAPAVVCAAAPTLAIHRRTPRGPPPVFS